MTLTIRVFAFLIAVTALGATAVRADDAKGRNGPGRGLRGDSP